MGCEQSQLAMAQDPQVEIPSKMSRNPKKKKNTLSRLHGRRGSQKVYEKVTRVDRPKNPEDLDFIDRAISKHFLLFKLTRNERKQLANAMNAYEAETDCYVFEQGTPASMFFIIQSGEVQIEVNGLPGRRLKKGEYFGELALIYSAPRSASVRTLQKCTFWCLSQYLFQKIQREMVKSNYRLAKPLVSKLPIFSFLSNKQKDAISYSMNTLKYREGEAIFKEGDDASSFYIIISGVVEIQIPGKSPIKFKNGDSFGENCLKPKQIRGGTALTLEKTELLAMSRQDIKACLGDKCLQELLFHNIVKWSLKRSQIFKNSTFDESKLISLGQFVQWEDGEIIREVGQLQDRIYISVEGKINDYEVGVLINEKAALQDDSKEGAEKEGFTNQLQLVKRGSGYVFSILIKFVQKQRYRQRRKYLESQRKLQSKRQLIKSARSSTNSLRVQLKDLYVMCKLGEGQMGKVYLVENKKTEGLYALKCVQKNIVIKHEMEKFLRAEKELLQGIDSPFIVKLYDTYKDTHFIYLLLNYIEGGDFFDFLSEIGTCNTSTAQFYFGCLALAIEYLHKNSIVYRDLKPENAVVDGNGYLKMIDLGTAKLLTEESETGFRTFTIIGTPHYMAPQVMEAKGYSFSVDIWSLGIILYQMLCGVLPYGGYSDDPTHIYKQIDKGQLRFPKMYGDPAGKDLIMRLLRKHPQKRAVDDFSQIKNHVFFKDFDWELLESQKMTAPLKPKIDSKVNSKSQYLLSYLQKQKLKMEKPVTPKNPNWDDIF